MEKNCKILTIPYIDDVAKNEILKKFQISVKYETEPPGGDGIYSIYLKEKLLPFWIYGRNIIFIDDTKAMLESVKCDTFIPIFSIIVDLENQKYANLMEWYTEIVFTNNQIELYNQIVKNKKLTLSSFDDLNWIDL